MYTVVVTTEGVRGKAMTLAEAVFDAREIVGPTTPESVGTVIEAVKGKRDIDDVCTTPPRISSCTLAHSYKSDGRLK